MKTDLELIHATCGQHLCVVEPGDALWVLQSVALDHGTSCPGASAIAPADQ